MTWEDPQLIQVSTFGDRVFLISAFDWTKSFTIPKRKTMDNIANLIKELRKKHAKPKTSGQ